MNLCSLRCTIDWITTFHWRTHASSGRRPRGWGIPGQSHPSCIGRIHNKAPTWTNQSINDQFIHQQ